MEKGGLEESSFVVEKSGKHYLSQVLKVKTPTVVSDVDSMYPSCAVIWVARYHCGHSPQDW